MKESIELVHTSEYAHFLEAYLGPFQQILQQVPVANQDSPGHKLRNMVLEILNRYPHSLLGVVLPCPVRTAHVSNRFVCKRHRLLTVGIAEDQALFTQSEKSHV